MENLSIVKWLTSFAHPTKLRCALFNSFNARCSAAIVVVRLNKHRIFKLKLEQTVHYTLSSCFILVHIFCLKTNQKTLRQLTFFFLIGFVSRWFQPVSFDRNRWVNDCFFMFTWGVIHNQFMLFGSPRFNYDANSNKHLSLAARKCVSKD